MRSTDPTTPSRRRFLQSLGLGAVALEAVALEAFPGAWLHDAMTDAPDHRASAPGQAGPVNMIGAYGPWAAGLAEDPPTLSFRRSEWTDVDAWRDAARDRLALRLAAPDSGDVPAVTVRSQTTHDGLHVEELSWQLPYGPPTEAVLLKPAGAEGPLPGVLAFHDHGGDKFFGRQKIVHTNGPTHPMMVRHQERLYEGTAWANELARRGYAVLVPDAYAFGSRRVRLEEVPERLRGDLPPTDPETEAEIEAYNRWAADHEHIMAKSLFSAGTTWPGVTLAEDRRALDVLCARQDVDETRVGCGGLSGGGLRTVFLGGADERIQCAVCVGMMTTWRDYLLYKCYTHTWMIYVPLLPRELDYPELLALRAPRPTLVQSNRQDPLFTLEEMERADRILSSIFEKAEASDHYRGTFYDGPHKFDRAMQAEAFDWFDAWL